MRLGRGRDYGVFLEPVGPVMHQARPEAEDRGVHRQDVERGGDIVGPPFDLRRPDRVLVPRERYAPLDLAQRDDGQVERSLVDVAQPGQDAAVRPLAPEFGYDIGVEQIHPESAVRGSTPGFGSGPPRGAG